MDAAVYHQQSRESRADAIRQKGKAARLESRRASRDKKRNESLHKHNRVGFWFGVFFFYKHNRVPLQDNPPGEVDDLIEYL